MADFILKVEKKMEILNKNVKFARKKICPICKTKINSGLKETFICLNCDTKLYMKKHPKTYKPMLLTNEEISNYEILKNEFKSINKYYRRADKFDIELSEQRLKELRIEFLNKLITTFENYSIVDEFFIDGQFEIFSVASEIVDREIQEEYGLKSLYYLSFDKQTNIKKFRSVLKYLYKLNKDKEELKEMFYHYNPNADKYLFGFIYKSYTVYSNERDKSKADEAFNQQIQFEMNQEVYLDGSYVVLDLETTGLSKEQNKIIEIGAVKVVDGIIVDEFSELVDPKININPYIQKLTSITNSDVRGKDTEDIVLERFMSFMDGVDYLVGHNIKGFDYPFLKLACSQNNIEMDAYPCVDTLDIAMNSLGHYIDKFSLSRLSYYFDVDLTNAHRAIYDVYATYELYHKHLKKYLEGFTVVKIDVVESTAKVRESLLEYFTDKKRFSINESFLKKDNYSITRIRNAEEFFDLGNLITVRYQKENVHLVVKGKTTSYNIVCKFNDNFSELLDIDCDCPASAKYKGLCKHSISVFMWLKDIHKTLKPIRKNKFFN